LIGLNGHLSTIAVPVAAGRTYTVYVGGSRILNLSEITEGGVASTSPFITVNSASVVQQQTDETLSVISFDVEVGAGAPEGEYSLRLQSVTGEVSYIAGALTVDANADDARNASSRIFIAPAAMPGTAADTMAAGSLAVFKGAGGARDEELFAKDEDAEREGWQLPVELGETSVQLTFSNGVSVQAPVAFVRDGSVGFQIPEEAPAGTALVAVLNKGNVAVQTALEITRSQPLVFTENGTGQGIALAFNEETLLPGPFNTGASSQSDADTRTRVVVYGSGFRQASELTALLGGRTVEVASVSPAENLPGLDKLVIIILDDAGLRGPKDFTIIADGKESNRTQLIIAP
jgi:uncharacterized protein (TIGR03437 family)